MKKFALVGLFVFVIGAAGTIFHWDQFTSIKPVERVEKELSIESDSVDSIIVNSDVSNVNFYKSDSDQIVVNISGVSTMTIEDVFTVDQSDHTLYLTLTQYKGVMPSLSFIPSIFNKELELKVGLPKTFSGKVEVDLDVGHVMLNDLELEQFTGKVDVGGISGSNLELNQARAEVNVGDIDLTRVTGEWYLQSEVGDLKLCLLEWQGNIEAYADIGDITIQLPPEPEDYTLHLESELGEIRGVDFPVIEKGNRHDPILRAKSDLGDIFIEWED